MPYLEMALALVFATAMAKGGEMEARGGRRNHGLLWAAVSVLVSVLVVAVLGGGYVWLIVSQIALFVAIGALRAFVTERD